MPGGAPASWAAPGTSREFSSTKAAEEGPGADDLGREPPRTAKEKALEAALQQIVKSHGSGSIMKLGDNREDIAARLTQGVIPTGSLSLDAALGIGGVPRGRVVEVFGPEASGKVRARPPARPRAPSRPGNWRLTRPHARTRTRRRRWRCT